jgi:hypothetical protein
VTGWAIVRVGVGGGELVGVGELDDDAAAAGVAGFGGLIAFAIPPSAMSSTNPMSTVRAL